MIVVPTTTPISNANINPLITSPPNKKMINNTKNVVSEVFIVRLKVLFNAAFTIFSRTRLNTKNIHEQ